MTGPMGPASFDGFDEPEAVRAARLYAGTIDETDFEPEPCACGYDVATMEFGPKCITCVGAA